ncbi:carbon storage regulator [Pseudomonas sp. TH49]|nr:carbon storage regulator [Pseudomonas sp. TH49]MBK5344665.1 carbon storage regulator [Pseudomonas sp. TH49]
MLVLTRTPNEHLCIGEEIKIKVIKVEGSTVSLGVMAPKEIFIVRSEQDERALNNTSITFRTP